MFLVEEGSACAEWLQNRQAQAENKSPATTDRSLKLKHKRT